MNYTLDPAVTDKLDAILRTLPGAVIAGGYIRDLLLGLPARDIDIMVEADPTEGELRQLERLLGVYFAELDFKEKEEYQANEEGFTRTSDIKKVYKDDEHNVADIIVVSSIRTHIREFPDNISKCWYSVDGVTVMSEFIYGHANKIIKYRNGAPEPRLLKLMSKFPDYTVQRVDAGVAA